MATPARDPAIEELFAPHQVVAYTSPVSAELIASLHEDERTATAPMAPARIAEFATARACARAALAEIGVSAPVPKQPGGAPLWPDGTAGSISHTRGFCVAVAAAGGLCLGIDAEVVARMKPQIERRVLIDSERLLLDDLDGDDRRARVGTIFAAKEAFYKAHYEVDPRYLGFDAVHVDISDRDVRFMTASGEVDEAILDRTTGRIRFDSGRVIVAVTIATTAR